MGETDLTSPEMRESSSNFNRKALQDFNLVVQYMKVLFRGKSKEKEELFRDVSEGSWWKARSAITAGHHWKHRCLLLFARGEVVLYISCNQERHKGSVQPTQQKQQASKLLAL